MACTTVVCIIYSTMVIVCTTMSCMIMYPCNNNNIIIGTHEVHNVSVDQNTLMSQHSLTWNFINGSNAPGVLIVAYSLMYNSDIHYDVILRPTIYSRTQTTLLGSVSGNQYNISMFVLLENGQPFTRSVAKPFTVTLSGKGNHEQ